MKIRSKEVIELFVDSILDIPICDAEKHICKLFPGEDERAVMLEELYRQLSLRRSCKVKSKERVKFKLIPPKVQLKLSQEGGVWRVVHKGRVHEYTDPYDALLYIYTIKLIVGRSAWTVDLSASHRINALFPCGMRPKVVHITLGGVVSFEQEYR